MASMRTFSGTLDEKVALNEQWLAASSNPDSKALAAFGYQESKRKFKDPAPTVEQYVQKLLPEPPSPSDHVAGSLPMPATPVPEIVQQRVAYLQQLFEEVQTIGPGGKVELLSERDMIDVFRAVPDDEQRIQLMKAFDDAQVKSGGSSLAKTLSTIVLDGNELVHSIVGPESAAVLREIARNDGSGPEGELDGDSLKVVAQDLSANAVTLALVQFGFAAQSGGPRPGESTDVMKHLDQRIKVSAEERAVKGPKVSKGNVLILKQAMARDYDFDGHVRLADEKSARRVFESLRNDDKARVALIEAVDAELKEEKAPTILESIVKTKSDLTLLLNSITGSEATEILKRIDDNDGAYVHSGPEIEKLKEVVESLEKRPELQKLVEFGFQAQRDRFSGRFKDKPVTVRAYLEGFILGSSDH